MKRAYSPKDIRKKVWKTIGWEDMKWRGPFGDPAWSETWFVSGQSASGKSSFVMQLAKKLCEYSSVLYLSYEEGISQSFKERMEREKMNEVQGRFRVALDDSIAEVEERLKRSRSPHFVIVDSFQYAGWGYEDAKRLVNEFPKKSFIFISQEYKGQPLGKAAARLRYMAGIKVRVVGFVAYCQGRFTEDAGGGYVVWEEGVMRTTNRSRFVVASNEK